MGTTTSFPLTTVTASGIDIDWTGLHSFALGPVIKPNNVGGKTRTELQTMFGLDASEASAWMWNYTNGGAELDLMINSSAAGGLSIWRFPNTSGDPVRIFDLRNSGMLRIGSEFVFSPASGSFSGMLQAYSTSTAGSGLGNTIVGSVLQNSAPSTTNFPTGVTGYGKQDAAATGNHVFGMFGRADLYATGSAIGAEINSFNFSGNAATSTLPPDLSIGTSGYYPVTLTLAAGGDDTSAIALLIGPEGSQPNKYVTGIYMKPDGITDTGLYIDAATAAGSQGPTTSALIKNYGDGVHLKLQTSGAFQSSNPVLQVLTSAGIARFGVAQSGQITSVTGASFGFATFGTGTLALSGTTSGTVTITPQDAAGTYNFNLPTTAGSSGDILTSAGGGSSPMTWTGSTGTGNIVRAASPTITGTLAAATATFSGNVTIQSTTPNLIHYDTDAGADAKIWNQLANGNTLTFRTVNDAQNATASWLVVTRSGNSISSVGFQGGDLVVRSDTATPAGGSTAARLVFGTTSGFGIYYGSGAPSVSAAQGSIYLRSDGSSTSTRMYVNNSSGSGTTWTNVTTGA